MKPEEINALYEKAYSNVGPEQADLLWQSWAGRAANAWPALYREMVAARAMRDGMYQASDALFNGYVIDGLEEVDAYDAARKETDQ